MFLAMTLRLFFMTVVAISSLAGALSPGSRQDGIDRLRAFSEMQRDSRAVDRNNFEIAQKTTAPKRKPPRVYNGTPQVLCVPKTPACQQCKRARLPGPPELVNYRNRVKAWKANGRPGRTTPRPSRAQVIAFERYFPTEARRYTSCAGRCGASDGPCGSVAAGEQVRYESQAYEFSHMWTNY